MNFNLTAIVRFVVILIACLLAIAFGATIGEQSSLLPILFVCGIIVIAISWAFPDWLLLGCIVCTMLAGRSGLGFGYWEMLTGILIGRWLLTVPFHGGLFGKIFGKVTFVCIAGFTLILVYHGLPALLGLGNSVGRRLAVMALVALGLAYLILTGKADTSRLPWLPWVGLLPGLISSTFDLINLAIPAALPITFAIYNNQNWEIIAAYQGAQSSLIRISGFRELGLALAFLALVYFIHQREFDIRKLLTQVIGVAVGAALAMVAGYRSFVAQIGIGTLIACYARSKQTFLAALGAMVLCITSLVYIQSEVVELPLTVQRALSWLPGDWDWRTKSSADDGFKWREEIRGIYFDRIFPTSWLLGRGLVYDERMNSIQWMALDPTFNTEYFVTFQSYHSGLVSALDFVGVIGCFFLIVASLRAIFNGLTIIINCRRAQKWHIWCALMFLTFSTTFWYTGFFEQSFPFICVFACLLEVARKDFLNSNGSSPNLQDEESVSHLE